jgi:hypothetical protein
MNSEREQNICCYPSETTKHRNINGLKTCQIGESELLNHDLHDYVAMRLPNNLKVYINKLGATMHMKSCDHGLPLIRNRNLNKNLFNAGHGPICRMDNNQYDSICMSNHQPLYIVIIHYIPIIFQLYWLLSNHQPEYHCLHTHDIPIVPPW